MSHTSLDFSNAPTPSAPTGKPQNDEQISEKCFRVAESELVM
jgi:hypothetical protein